MFSLERWGHHDQAVLVVRSALRPGVARSLIDPVALPATRPRPSTGTTPSPGGRLVAYGLSTNGDERSTLHVVDVESGRMLTDTIADTRGASVAWAPDATAFAYSRYPHEGEVPDDERDYWRKVFWHQLGTDPARDPVVWDDLPDKTAWPNVSLSADGRWLLVHVSIGWSRVDVHLIDRSTGARTVMIEGIEAVSSFEVVGDEAIGITTLDADRGRVVSAPLSAAWHDNWCTIIPESDAVLEALVGHVRLAGRAQLAVGGLDARPVRPRRHRPPVDRPRRAGLAGRPVAPATSATRPSSRSPRSPARRPCSAGARARSTTGAASASPTAGATGRRAPTSSSRCATRRPTAPRSRCS